MRKLRLLLKKFLIIYVVIFLGLSSLSQCDARLYDAECGKFVSEQSIQYVDKYGNCSNIYDNSCIPAYWSGGTDGSGTFHVCCSTWVQYMYQKFLGVDITKDEAGGISMYCPSAWGKFSGGDTDKVKVIKSASQLEPGDMLLKEGHMELFVGDGKTTNGGHGGNHTVVHGSLSSWPVGSGAVGLRLQGVDVNPSGSVPLADLEEEDLNIYDSNGFIYTGVPTLSGYKNSPPFSKWIIKMLKEIVDYLIGILTFGIRVVIVGWTAIVERVFIDGIVNAVTGVTDDRVDDWKAIDPDEQETLPGTTTSPSPTTTEETQPIGSEGDANYVSAGVVDVGNVGGKIDLNPSSEANITVENIVYNKVPILDVNFFNFESAGGAVVDKDGIIYLLKSNVAMWYYIFEIMAVVMMLAVLIYCGIRMALSTVAEKKAVYKRMLVDWLVGFFLVVAVAFIIYFVIDLNETFISWVIPKHEDGSEILVYETIRSKAYELKASTGFTGMILYIIMVYYAIRFLVVYFKRYLTAMILALMGPFMAVSYAIEKVNKGGRGGAKKFGDWLRDFVYTIIMQSMHALIYTIFIVTILKLTEVSLAGMLISFIFMGFMLKVDPIFRNIFGLTGGKNVGKLTVGDGWGSKVTNTAAAGAVFVKDVAKGYGNFAGKAIKPVGAAMDKLGNKLNEVTENISRERALETGMTPEEYEEQREAREREKEEKRKKREKRVGEVIDGIKIAGGTAKTFALGALVLPMFIADQKFGTLILTQTIKTGQNTKKLIADAFKKGNWNSHACTLDFGRRLKFRGVVPKNERARRRLERQYQQNGYTYHLVDTPVTGNATTDGGSAGGSGGPGGTGAGGRGRGPAIKRPGFTNGLPNAVYMKLTESQKANLAANKPISKLRYADNVKDVEEVLEEQGIDAAVAYAELLAEAEEQEKELERLYEEAVGQLDEQIAEMERSDNPEMAKMARTLKSKRDKNFAETMRILKEPFNEKDIERAIKNYKSVVPQFDENSGFLSQQDIEGISKQIEKVLKSKGTEIELNKDFIAKVEKELKDKAAKDQAEQASRKQAIHVAGQDQTRTMADDVVEGTDLTLKEKIKALNTDDRGYNPYSTSNPNAPHSNGAKPSVQKVVSSIRAASKGATGKATGLSRSLNGNLSRTLDALEGISQRAKAFNGGQEMYEFQGVMEKLANI